MITAEEYVNDEETSEILLNCDCDEIIELIRSIQRDAYNQGVIDSAENVTTKQVKVEYTGVRAGGFYYVTDVDKESILKLKK